MTQLKIVVATTDAVVKALPEFSYRERLRIQAGFTRDFQGPGFRVNLEVRRNAIITHEHT